MDLQLVRELRNSIKDCSDRGLVIAGKWSAELYLSIPQHKRDALVADSRTGFSTSTPARAYSPHPSLAFATSPALTGGSGIASESHKISEPSTSHEREAELEQAEEATLFAAQSYFTSKDFSRAVHVLRNCQSTKARFLSLYCQFLISEKKTERDWYKHYNIRGHPPIPFNQSLIFHLEVVKNATDPWLLFLKGLFLSRLNKREESIESIISSIGRYPWNWSAWILLGRCIGDGEELSSLLPLLPLPASHPLVQFFQIRTMNELNSPTENELLMCDRLLGEDFFRGSAWVMGLRAGVLYHLHDFGQAEKQFEKILAVAPCRVDDIDVYSNILYVTENRLKLSRLAHEFLELDKDRPEVCCLVGNHYSLRAEHEKAVKYFRRATELDRTYLSAWTLMGHEYVEMKNSHAAIEAYRRAVDVNRKDYRAWYGLGQAYELLSMHQYALFYYQRATALRPYDVRLWQAQASCYEEIGRTRDAVECLKRALLGADARETAISLKLAKLYEELEEAAEAAAYHRRVVEICRAEERPVQDYAKSCIYVARHQMVSGGDLSLAKECLERVAGSNAEEVTQASEWLKRLNYELALNEEWAAVHAVTGIVTRQSIPNTTESRKMLNPQGSFLIQTFPLKSLQQSPKPHVWPSTHLDLQSPVAPHQSAGAGPSTTKSTSSPTSPDSQIVNTALYVKDRSEEELQIIQQTAAGFAACLAADHAAVLQPDVDTPFTDVADVANRLLPYHIFQQPGEDLNPLLHRKQQKGKEKARHQEIRQEMDDTRFALECHRRLKKLEDRLYRARIREGKRPSHDGQAYVLAQSILEAERAETAMVSSELRNARNQLDAIQREKRAASNTASTHPTVTTFRPTYYTQATPSPYYRTYSYAYTQQYGTGAQGTSAFYSTPVTVPQTTTVAATNYTPSTGPIPVQLPVTSLSALHSLGIVPVPMASVPPPDQPQPAAVLKGSTSNGTMLSLEINVSLLQSAQMSGLAILLNSLMSRGGQSNGAATTNTEPAAGQSLQNGVTLGAARGAGMTTQKEKEGDGAG